MQIHITLFVFVLFCFYSNREIQVVADLLFSPVMSVSIICLGTRWTDWALTSDVFPWRWTQMQKQHLTEHLVHQVLLSTHSLLTLKITLEKSQDPKQDRLEGLSQPEYTVTAHRKSGFFRKHTDSDGYACCRGHPFPLQRLKRSLPRGRNSLWGPPGSPTETGMQELRHTWRSREDTEPCRFSSAKEESLDFAKKWMKIILKRPT